MIDLKTLAIELHQARMARIDAQAAGSHPSAEPLEPSRRGVSGLRPTDQPAIWMNKTTMERYRPEMRKYYFDTTKYKTYMDQMDAQFGIKYPTVTKPGPTQP